MKTISRIFRHNWQLKATAVGLAVLLWAVVLLKTNPWTTEWFDAAVETKRVPDGLQVMSITPPKIKVRLAGRRHSVDRLTGRDLAALAVIGTRDVGEHEVPILFDTTEFPRGVEVLDLSVHSVQVALDQTVQQKRAVLTEFRGRTASGFAALPGRPRPNEVTVAGPLTLVNAVAAVVAVVDYSGIQSTRTFTSRLEARDARGMPQQEVTISPATAQVEVAVEPINVKPVPVKLELSVAAGRRVQSVDMSPSVVTITGKPDSLRQIEFVRTKPIHATEDGVLPNVELQLPTGVTVVGEEPFVRVTVTLAPLPAPRPRPPTGASAPERPGDERAGGGAPKASTPQPPGSANEGKSEGPSPPPKQPDDDSGEEDGSGNG